MLDIVQDQFDSVFGRLTPPPIEHDREVMRLHAITDSLKAMRPHMKAMGDALQGTQAAGLAGIQPMIDAAQLKAKRLSRLETMVEFANFIGTASLLERKLIINELIDTDPTGDVSGLEDYACALSGTMEYEPHQAGCRCDACVAARSDEHFDRRRDGLMIGGA